jgi:hypothetical protein
MQANAEFETRFAGLAERLTALDHDANAATAALHTRVDAMRAEIDALRRGALQNDSEIDALQIAAARAERPWYAEPSLVLSVLALLFSFGTTAVSAYRTAQQDVHDARAELRTFLRRLSELPVENVRAMREHSAVDAAGVSGLLNQENSLLAYQAAEVMQRIPNQVSSTEYLLVASAFLQSGNVERATELAALAGAAAKDVNQRVSALRTQAGLRFLAKDLAGGRAIFASALTENLGQPVDPREYALWNDAQTEIVWASAEVTARQCAEAAQHLERARAFAAPLPDNSAIAALRRQIAELGTTVAACQ